MVSNLVLGSGALVFYPPVTFELILHNSSGSAFGAELLRSFHGVWDSRLSHPRCISLPVVLRVQTPALNHLGLWVHPLPEAVEWLTQQGLRFTPGGIRKGAAGHDVAFIHPKGDHNSPMGGEGVLIELVQAPPDVIAHAEQ